jgi:hypothetical protein
MKQLPQLADVATDQQTGGLAVSLVIDRVTASRLGIAPSTIDNTLYDAYGQRQISTMYTQLNQYHVILEADPSFQQTPGQTAGSVHPDQCLVSRLRARSILVLRVLGVFVRRLECDHDQLPTRHPRQCSPHPPNAINLRRRSHSSHFSNTQPAPRRSMPFRSVRSRILRGGRGALHQSPGPVPGGHRVVQSRSRRFAGRRDHGHRQGAKRSEHAGQRAVWISGHRGRISGLALQ